MLNDDPYPVRGLLIAAASPALTYPDKKLWHKVYEKLDFLVVNERFMSEEIMYADVVFPATTYCQQPLIWLETSKSNYSTIGRSKKRCSYFTGTG